MRQKKDRSVVVVGGGLAGCAAATVLAEHGVKVTVVERESFLGGRAGAYLDELRDGTVFEMERGFHAFFRNYRNLRALLRRVDPQLSCLTPLSDYPLYGPNGQEESFANLTRLPVLNLLQLIVRSKSLQLWDLRRADLDRARAMLEFDGDRTYARFDGISAKEFLDSLRFPAKARQMLFDVFAHSFFNPEEDYSAAELLSMFHYYFLRNPEGLVFDVMKVPFKTGLWDPLRSYLERLGASFMLETSATALQRSAGAVRVEVLAPAGALTLDVDAVVLALDVRGLQAVVAASDSLAAEREAVASLQTTLPFAVLRLFLDRPLRADRPPFCGTSGFGILDNISIYDRFESESRQWAARTGGSVVELHAYAVPQNASADQLRSQLMSGLFEVYPEARQANVVEERFLLRQDCPAFAPGSNATRPGVVTAYPEVMFAGDFVKLPFPSALMERATSAGFLAGNALVGSFRLGRGVAVEHGPRSGLLASLGRP